MTYKSAILALALFCSGLAPFQATAEPTRADVVTLSLWGMVDEQGRATGAFLDFSKAIAEEAGVEADFELIPVKRFFKRIEHGQTDWSVFLRSEYSARAFVALALVMPDVDTVVIPRKDVRLEDYDDLAGLRIAIPRGTTFDHKATSDKAIRRIETGNYSESARMLKGLRLDGMLGLAPGLYFAAKEAGLGRDDLGPPLFLRNGEIWLHAAPHFAGTPEAEKLRAAAERLRTRGVFEKILRAYLD